MRVIAIDIKRAGAWNKRWSTLDIPGLVVYTPEEGASILSTCTEATLILAHEAAYTDEIRRRDLEAAVSAVSPLCFLLFVSHSGSPHPETLTEGLVHLSGVPFPNQTFSLASLTRRLERLIPRLDASRALEEVDRESVLAKRTLAWEQWEDEPEDYLEAIWGLCEAYLAVNVDQLEEELASSAGGTLEHARDWLGRYRSAISAIAAADAAVTVDHEQRAAMIATPDFWRVSERLDYRDLAGYQWRGAREIERLLSESKEGMVRFATVVAAYEALAEWMKTRDGI